MIPLAVAQEAAERQQQWLNQLQHELDAPDRARQVIRVPRHADRELYHSAHRSPLAEFSNRQAALDSERDLRKEQDLEYQQVRGNPHLHLIIRSFLRVSP